MQAVQVIYSVIHQTPAICHGGHVMANLYDPPGGTAGGANPSLLRSPQDTTKVDKNPNVTNFRS